MDTSPALTALRAASVGEVAWLDGGGEVRVRGVLPLAGPSGPVLALPYAAAAAARSLGRSGGALLVSRDGRSTSSAWRPATLRCRPRLEEDPEGVRFTEDLLEQELRRYPPSRVLADSVLLRREHWWWLPRLLVHLDVVEELAPLPREDDRDHLLVTDTGAGTGVDSGAPGDPVHRLTAGSVRLAALPAPGDPLPALEVRHGAPGAGPGVLHGQDLSFPDLERWTRWSWRGAWDGASLDVAEQPERVGLEPVPGVRRRWSRQRELEKACRRELKQPTP